MLGSGAKLLKYPDILQCSDGASKLPEELRGRALAPSHLLVPGGTVIGSISYMAAIPADVTSLYSLPLIRVLRRA